MGRLVEVRKYRVGIRKYVKSIVIPFNSHIYILASNDRVCAENVQKMIDKKVTSAFVVFFYALKRAYLYSRRLGTHSLFFPCLAHQISTDKLGSEGKIGSCLISQPGSVPRCGTKLRHSPERGLAGTERVGPEPNVNGVSVLAALRGVYSVGLRFFRFRACSAARFAAAFC